MKNIENFKKLFFWKSQTFSIFRKISKKWLFKIFDFSKCFEKYFSSKKWIFPEHFQFSCFIVFHVYPERVASRNSHCAARGRGKRPRRQSEKHENSYFWRFFGTLFPYNLYKVFIKICGSKKFNPKISSKIRTFFENFSVFHFLSCFIPNLWKFHCATPSTPRARQNRDFFSHYLGKSLYQLSENPL